MNYTITPGGIVYDIGQDTLSEDRVTDAISDAQQQPPPIPDDVAVAVIKREAAKIEEWANVPTLSR